MLLIRFFSRLPLSFLHSMANLMAFFAGAVLGYRRTVVFGNVKRAFPTKSDKEIVKICRQFYRHLFQVFAESIKSYSIAQHEWKDKMELKNIEKVQQFLDAGTPVILISGHTSNWEWPAYAIGAQIDYPFEFLYKKVESEFWSRLMMSLRMKHGGIPIDKDNAMRDLIKRRKKPRLIGFISDQLPAIGTDKKWIPFFNKETAFYVGAERAAQALGYPVFYTDIERLSTGKYQVTFRHVSSPPYEKGTDYGITEKFVHLLSDTINRNPIDYLWSHRRWKYTKEEEATLLAKLKSTRS